MIFSLVIPVYNASNFIEGLVESIDRLAHQPDSKINVYLIENGSDDGSYEICDELTEKYGFVSCAHFGKIGAFRARREGMKLISGDYAFFLDADDEISENLIIDIEKCLLDRRKYATGGNVQDMLPDIIQYNAAGTDSRDKRMFDFPFEEGKVYSGDDKRAFYEVMCKGDSLNALWNKCISNKLIKKVLLDESLNGLSISHGEDLLQTAQLLDLADSIVYLDKILYYYRVNPAGLTAGFHKDFLDDQIKAWERFDVYMTKWLGKNARTSKGNLVKADEATFAALVDKRKALTCSIAIDNVIYSDIPYKQKKLLLKELMDSDFYAKYGKMSLPTWAPEADVFVHNMQVETGAYDKLLRSARKYGFKTRIKKLLGQG